MLRKQLAFVGVAITALVFVGAGCSNSASPGPAPAANNSTEMDSGSTPPTTIQSGTVVVIKNLEFTPSELHVKVGDTVTWTNNDNTSHTITNDSGAFESGTLVSGKTFTHTFLAAGTFSYHCSFHPHMTGKIIVE